jgi:AraC-like DNA-binding protein
MSSMLAAQARCASLTGYAEVARSLGLDPIGQLRAARLDLSCLSDPDLMVPVHRVNALLESSAVAAGVEDFGLRLATTRRLSNLGLIALAAREEPTVREALLCLQRTMQLHNEAVRLELEEVEGVAIVRTGILALIKGPVRQRVELTFYLLRELLGASWSPTSVFFVHSPPRKLATYRKVFGIAPRFHAEGNGIGCRSSDLDRPVPRADPQSRRTLQRVVETNLKHRTTYRERTVHLILELLPSARCTVERVAGFLGVDRRTLLRRLQREGTTFSSLVDEVRMEAARRHLPNPNQSIEDLAPVLGFSNGSSLARWFSARTGRSPRHWRQEQARGEPDGG